MKTNDLTPASTRLRKGEILHLQRALGQRIEALGGRIWITMDGDLRDVVIDAGEGFTVDRSSDVLVSAISDAQLVLLLPTAAAA